MSSDNIAFRSYPKLPVTQSMRSSQVRSLKPMMQKSQNLLPQYSIPLPSFKICELQESNKKLCLLRPRIEKGPSSRQWLLCIQRGWPTAAKDFGQFTTVWTSSTPQQLDQHSSAPCTWPHQSQWIQENLCSTQAVVLLERDEKGCANALQALSSVCKAEGW